MNQDNSSRLRPALDLLNAVSLKDVQQLTDLGCGPGNVIPYLREKYPNAKITAVDRSTEWLMLAKSHHGDDFECVQGDVAGWQPEQDQDLIYANASLNQLGDHEHLFPRLMGYVRPGGTLAVQMPDQYKELSHAITLDVAGQGPWAEILKPRLPTDPVAVPDDYRQWLAPLCGDIKVWDTSYDQVVVGRDGVVDWVMSTDLGLLREALPPDLKGPFRTALAEKLREVYPPGEDGKTVFGFRRLFLVATRSAA